MKSMEVLTFLLGAICALTGLVCVIVLRAIFCGWEAAINP